MKESVQLTLSSPCHENWNAMTPTEQGRHCQACCKTVIDFTTMTDREIAEYILHYSAGNTCARVYDNQLNRQIQAPPERKGSWKYFWSIALSSLLISYRSLAQVQPPRKAPAAISGMDISKVKDGPVIRLGGITAHRVKDTITTTVNGRIVNEQGIPVPFASITLNNPTRVFVADVEGNYSFSIRSEQISFTEMMISAAGYESFNVPAIHADSIQSLEIIKKTVKVGMKNFVMKQKLMKDVVVVGYGTQTKSDMVGGITSCVRVTRYEKVKQKVAALYRSDIKIYPNPAPANSSFNLQFNLKQAGEYNVQFIDVSGKIVGGKRVMINTAGQTKTFTGDHLPGRGAYFVRVAGRNDRKIYNAKLVVQ